MTMPTSTAFAWIFDHDAGRFLPYQSQWISIEYTPDALQPHTSAGETIVLRDHMHAWWLIESQNVTSWPIDLVLTVNGRTFEQRDFL